MRAAKAATRRTRTLIYATTMARAQPTRRRWLPPRVGVPRAPARR
jgi:hypothetical protein